MKLSKSFLLLALIPLAAPAALETRKNPALIDVQNGTRNPAPEELSYDAYMKWVTPLIRKGELDGVSGFSSKIFEWYEEEKNRGLPREVFQDRERIYVNVQRPLRQTIELEENGDIEEGNTVGAEVYAEQKGTVKQALDTMLYRWGKPVKAGEGHTYPSGGQFARRIDYFAANPDWGTQAFASLTIRRDGGIVKDLFDRYIVLLRGDEERGYDVLMQFLKPGGKTKTQQVLAIAMIRPQGEGKISYKISTRFQGQSYKFFGVEYGRKKVGFNAEKVRSVQVESNAMLKELQDTGNIKDHKTDIGYED